jgi:CspA family cold shock protein
MRHSGKVKWFDDNRGCGIIRAAGGREFPVRYADIEGEGYKSLAEGERVEFDILNVDGRARAIRVRRRPAGDV